MASFSEAENAYILPGANSYITQTVDFGGHQVGYRLGLRVRARNVGTATEEEQNIGLKVEMEGQTSAVGPNYWLVKPATGGRRPTSGYMWRNTESSFEEDLTTPSEAEDASDAQDIDIVLPLYREGLRAFAYAKRIKLTIFNPKGLYNIHVYDVSLVKYEQIKGYEANVTIDNMAREAESDVDLTITAGDLAPAAGNVFMTGLPLRPTDSEVITKWQIENNASQDYLAAMAFDYSRGISLPRMKYSGILNVPGSATVLPTLFLRDGTYYFPHTYSYDLYSDEITVELISISAADVSLSSVAISQTTEAVGTMGATTGGTSGGGGAVSIPRDKQMSDTSDNAVENKVIKAYVDQAKKDVEDLLASMWQLIGDRVVTDKKTVVENDLIVEGDVATGGSGGGTAAAGTVTGVLVGSDRYEDVTAGLLDLTEAFNKIDVSEQLKGYLPLSGGVITSTEEEALRIYRKDGAVGINFTAGQENGWVGFSPAVYGAYIYTNSHYLHITTAGKACFDNKELIHSGNIAAQLDSRYFRANYGSLPTDKDLATLPVGSYWVYENTGLSNKAPITYSSLVVLGKSYYAPQLSVIHNASRAWLRGIYNGESSSTASEWHELAFLDSNVASATKLQTARTIWGQSFDGSGNVSGALYLGTGTIRSSKSGTDRVFIDFGSAGDPYIGYGLASAGIDSHLCGNTVYLCYGTSRTNGLILNSSGNVTIGAQDLAGTFFKLMVDGVLGMMNGTSYSGILAFADNTLYLGYSSVTHKTTINGREVGIQTSGDGLTRLFVKLNGNVGIGNTDPQYKLDVTGTFHVSGNTTLTGWLSAESSLSVAGNAYMKSNIFMNDGGEGIYLATAGNAIAWHNASNAYSAALITFASNKVTLGQNTAVSGNLVVSGDVSTGGDGMGTGAAGTVTGIAVNGQTYEPTAGIVTIPDYPTSLTWSAINGRPTHLSDFTDDVVSGKYLPLSGGVITSTEEEALRIYRKDGAVGINFTAGQENGWVGFSPAVYGAYIYTNSHYLHITTAGKACFDNKELIHSGNIAAQLDSRYFRANYGSLPTDKDLATLPVGSYWVYENTGLSNKAPITYSSLVVLGKSYYAPQLSVIHNASRAWLRGIYNGESSSTASEWHELAFLDSNVASATKLQTARTIWGQSFDGSGNVSGALYLGTGTIRSSKSGTDRVFIDFGSAGDPYIGYGLASAGIDSHLCGNTVYLCYGTSRTNGLILNSSGNVTIGAQDLAGTFFKLMVDGVLGMMNGTSYSGILAFADNTLYLGYSSVTHKTTINGREVGIQTSGDGLTRLFVKLNGNVGIGNTDPQYKLDVTGTFHVSGNTTLTGWLSAESSLSVAGNAYMKSNIFMNDGGEGIYLATAGNAIAWHNASNAYSAALITFASNKVTLGQNTAVSGNLVVSGDVSTGGNGGGSSSGGSGDSLCLGPVELDMQSISSLGTFTQAQMDGFGLTTTVISNMLAGLYTKVIGWGGGDVYDYNGFGVIGSIIRLYFRQGNGESVDYTYTLYYDKTKWTVTEN